MPIQKKNKALWNVLIAISLGIIIGTLTQPASTLFGIPLHDYAFPIYEVCGKVFINALMLIVVPLVSSSIITGIAKIGNEVAFGRLGGKIFSFYLGTSFVAIIIGLFFVNIFKPGLAVDTEAFASRFHSVDIQQHVMMHPTNQLANILFQLIPSNIFEAFSRGQMLGVIFFSLIFGYCISRIESRASSHLIDICQGIFQAMIRFTHVIMNFLPLGVFFLVAKVFSEAGFQSLRSLGLFTLAVILGLGVFMFVALPLLLRWIGKVSPSLHFRAMGPALITAFSTSSSSATLPITMDCVEKRAGISNKISSLVVPLGTSINMSGSALYECVAAMFIAQAYGIELSILTQFTIVLMALITSIGVAGIPSASLVAVIVILKAIGLPIEGIGLFIAVDRVLDMCRTTVNVFSDSCCAVLVARSEGEKGILVKEQHANEMT